MNFKKLKALYAPQGAARNFGLAQVFLSAQGLLQMDDSDDYAGHYKQSTNDIQQGFYDSSKYSRNVTVKDLYACNTSAVKPASSYLITDE